MSTNHSTADASANAPSRHGLVMGMAAIALIATIGLLLAPTTTVAEKHVRDSSSSSPAMTPLGDATGVSASAEPAASQPPTALAVVSAN